METKNTSHSELVSESSALSEKIGRSRNKFGMTNFYGFTLVELIVVITILVILGTIAFLNLGGYSASARDSSRVSDMTNIAQGLELALVRNGTVPVPEAGSITVSASGVVIGYQGYAGSNVLSFIKMSEAKDPLDKKYYTYSTNVAYTKYEMLGLMEDPGTLTSADVPSGDIPFVDRAYAGYETRTPATRGSSLGVLLGNTGASLNVPVQENYSAGSFTGVDLVNTTGSYVMQFSNTEKISGTGTILKMGSGGGWLLGYWDFEGDSGSIAYDKIWTNNLTLSWWVSFSGWVSGSSLFFDGVNGYATNSWIIWLWIWNIAHTVSAWVKPYNTCTATGSQQCRQWLMTLWWPWNWSQHWLLYSDDLWTTTKWSQIGIWGWKQGGPVFTDGVWNNIALSYNGQGMRVFLNGNIVNTFMNVSAKTETFSLRNNSLILWKKQVSTEKFFNGNIDEVRIYNRALSDSEIQALYQAAR